MNLSALILWIVASWLLIHIEIVNKNRGALAQSASLAIGGTVIGHATLDSTIKLTQDDRSTCPRDTETLTSLLLRDIPGYANRVIQRARRLDRDVDTFSYVIIAGQEDFEPLDLTQNQYTSVLPESSEQIFFTTLERQYTSKQVIERQNYHWLFLTQTPSGPRMVTVFSRLGSSAKGGVPLPPKDTSDGVIGQAVRFWLRDCRAGAIRR